LKSQGNENPTTLKSMKIHSCKHSQLDNAVALFVQQAREQHLVVWHPYKKLYAKAISIENFEGSNG
jgi:hypothetical protein